MSSLDDRLGQSCEGGEGRYSESEPVGERVEVSERLVVKGSVGEAVHRAAEGHSHSGSSETADQAVMYAAETEPASAVCIRAADVRMGRGASVEARATVAAPALTAVATWKYSMPQS